MAVSYSIGVDLGTTNCVVSTVPMGAELPKPDVLKIRQLVQAGQVESYTALPSFLYLPRAEECESLRYEGLPDPGDGVAGVLARHQSADSPGRVVAAAKSWLCHSKAKRSEGILPWQAPEDVQKVSPVHATGQYLKHLVDHWHTEHPHERFEEQSVVLTVPASFDPASRELTRSAAVNAGFPDDFVLLEEPQAAVYRWLCDHQEAWRDQLGPDDTMLVVDIGGGTCDLTLVGLRDVDGELELQRIAVGNHLLVGGDNMDLAVAHQASQAFAAKGHQLDPWQSVGLWHACRSAKEKLLDDEGPDEQTVSVLGRGSSLIASTISTTLTREALRESVLEGFFPSCDSSARPVRQAQSGFQDLGLPYEQDPAITKHIAGFLSDQAGQAIGDAEATGPSSVAMIQPTHLLLNGGVFRSRAIRERVLSTIQSWCDRSPTLLGSEGDLDHSVALGAAYYGWSKHNGGIRIRGGTAKSYYIGIETAGLAIPGVPRPLRALCVAPQGMEEGTELEIPGHEVGVVVGQPARFRFFASSCRSTDGAGSVLDRWNDDELIESESIQLNLTSPSDSSGPSGSMGSAVPVRFRSRVTELGMFELWCQATSSSDEWKLEFSVRE